ncbi:uncharacterized protein K452DRAFT_312374 [Aplosporella prunicola CBS 121167]|uniref:Uncharacterized protein n=1 Tax=Aplosporella prunicola CBS 121167 TaxID=1176127 RepID=A0A6A6B2B9_9PEZI|nr:uncharacterized protein K452DRAFT_312374 [Aplosporella prunicola CBS 121167]KAF2137364.1 hypothetical protein K452DRAFT_312374 [Aplosporella prunicola CBS 121167]
MQPTVISIIITTNYALSSQQGIQTFHCCGELGGSAHVVCLTCRIEARRQHVCLALKRHLAGEDGALHGWLNVARLDTGFPLETWPGKALGHKDVLIANVNATRLKPRRQSTTSTTHPAVHKPFAISYVASLSHQAVKPSGCKDYCTRAARVLSTSQAGVPPCQLPSAWLANPNVRHQRSYSLHLSPEGYKGSTVPVLNSL